MTPLGNVSGSLLANYWRKKDARQAQAAAAKDPVQPACENLSKG
jgi:BASS family bile acid:Na+ symporter